ncbi:hypothetical protein HPP92_025715 [Vanilla planifolia]|uniref:Uncharacterized protein n=1 Tax=Vanilla planifolia TaxID=51239 RepID=A0A835U895_VANPL|nr:hypothetical protein HPP92_025988 [Vanilla planifolia]KAG0454411.1 hypothetical protein HPP92_025715 [Vanilla planifolia]
MAFIGVSSGKKAESNGPGEEQLRACGEERRGDSLRWPAAAGRKAKLLLCSPLPPTRDGAEGKVLHS